MTINLTSKAVHDIFLNCLFQEGEDTTGFVKAEGITINVGFHPGRLEAKREEIMELLMQLPADFQQGYGGGASFLTACLTKDGNLWGEHSNMQELFLLGKAIGKVENLFPKDMEVHLPGGVPYYVIK